ncbi:MAG: ABC transporter ATP-binding protein/permease [Ruminococcus sp.]|nr:ABC transporter ATP-binding protein/permease [Ruminococcus sp.]
MVKKLLSQVKEYKLPSILAPILVTSEVFMEVLLPFFTADLIDEGINKGDMSAIVKYGILLIFMALLSLTFGALSGHFAATASCGFAKNLRKSMFEKVQTFSFSNIDKFSTSSLVTRLTTDVTNAQNAYQMIIRVAVRSPIMFISSIVMAWVISPKMATIFLCIIPVLIVALMLIVKFARSTFEKVFKTYDSLNGVVQENLMGIRVVKSFVREDHEIEKFKGVSLKLYKLFSKAERLVSLNQPIMMLCMDLCLILISWIGSNLIITTNATELTTGQLTSMITYGMQILMSLMMLSMIFVMITMSRASMERIVEVLDEQSDLNNGENPVMEVKDGSIEFNNVSFSYSKREDNLCLKNVNLKIESGQTVGIIGGTGSSKSTFVQLIPRIYDTTIGSIKVGGIDVKDYDIETLRNEVAMVLQKNTLFTGTISENIRWGNKNASDEEVQHVCKLAQADDFIQTFPKKYDTYIEQGGTNVSGGQKQRLCIARALLKKPKILILDDSTSAVDTKTDSLIRKAFKEEIPNTTKIIIAQRISSIMDADKIIVLDNGSISAMGTHDELLKSSSIYQEVYYSQTKESD